nr:immunoglobulin heavy chain junction region [Macaca mulatta]
CTRIVVVSAARKNSLDVW